MTRLTSSRSCINRVIIVTSIRNRQTQPDTTGTRVWASKDRYERPRKLSDTPNAHYYRNQNLWRNIQFDKTQNYQKLFYQDNKKARAHIINTRIQHSICRGTHALRWPGTRAACKAKIPHRSHASPQFYKFSWRRAQTIGKPADAHLAPVVCEHVYW